MPDVQAVQGELQKINTTIDTVQAKLNAKPPTATTDDITALGKALDSLGTLLDKVKDKRQSAPTPLSNQTVETNRPAVRLSTARDAYVDLTQKLQVKTFETAFNALANERGESGRIQFKMEFDAAVGSGVGKVGGWLQTGIEYSKDDTGRVCMTLDYEAAVKAGVDLGWLKAEAFVGANGKLTLRFDTAKDAAAFTVDMLQRVNAGAQGALFTFAGPSPTYNKPTVIAEAGVFAGARVTAKAGDSFKFTGEVRAQTSATQFITPPKPPPEGDSKPHVHSGSITRLSGSADFQVKTGPHDDDKFGVKFEGFWEEVTGDPVEANNGISRGGSVEIDLTALKKLAPEKLNAALQQIAEKMKIPSGQVEAFIKGMTETIAQDYTGEKGETKGQGSVKLVINFQQQRESGGGKDVYNTQYIRVSLKTEYEAKTKVDSQAADMEVSFSASKTEKVYEFVGKNTETYIKGIYSNPTEWAQFKKENPGLIINVVVAQRPDGSPITMKMNVAELEKKWAVEEKEAASKDEQINTDAKAVAYFAGDWHVDAGEEEKILSIMRKYVNNPEKMQKLVDYLESKDISLQSLLSKVDESNTHNELVILTRNTLQFQMLEKQNDGGTKFR